MSDNFPRTYASLRTAKIAVNREELGREVVRYDEMQEGRIKPVVLADDAKHAQTIKRHGFAAEIKPTSFCEGATVRLKDSVPKERMGELARIVRFQPKGGAYLDRPIGGTRWWNLKDLVLIAPGEAG